MLGGPWPVGVWREASGRALRVTRACVLWVPVGVRCKDSAGPALWVTWGVSADGQQLPVLCGGLAHNIQGLVMDARLQLHLLRMGAMLGCRNLQVG